MLPDTIMQSDMLDILFEHRNKNYGAYALRRSYNKTIKAAITATVLLSACFAVTILMHHNKEIYLVHTFDLQDASLSTIKPEVVKPPQPATIKHVNNFRQVNNSTPVITSDNIKTTQPTIDEIDRSIIGAVAKTGEDADGKAEAAPSDNGSASQTTSTIVTPVVKDDAPLISADVMPEFPGGINALIKFIQRNIKQPDDLQPDEKIKVMASFVVTRNGAIENIKIINSGRTDLDKEVIKVINKMPLWKPGMQNGEAVAVYFNLPVTFQNADEQ